MNAPLILRFKGPVKCEPGPGCTGVTLLGRIEARSPDQPHRPGGGLPAQLSLIGSKAVRLPATLDDVVLEALDTPEVLLRAGGRERRIQCKTVQLHWDAGAAFYAAIPPRPTPWPRRFTWRLLLGLAATAPGRWLLSR